MDVFNYLSLQERPSIFQRPLKKWSLLFARLKNEFKNKEKNKVSKLNLKG